VVRAIPHSRRHHSTWKLVLLFPRFQDRSAELSNSVEVNACPCINQRVNEIEKLIIFLSRDYVFSRITINLGVMNVLTTNKPNTLVPKNFLMPEILSNDSKNKCTTFPSGARVVNARSGFWLVLEPVLYCLGCKRIAKESSCQEFMDVDIRAY
jgi:hypothetical protein